METLDFLFFVYMFLSLGTIAIFFGTRRAIRKLKKYINILKDKAEQKLNLIFLTTDLKY